MENLLNPRDPVVPSRWKTQKVPDFTGLTYKQTEFQIAVSIVNIIRTGRECNGRAVLVGGRPFKFCGLGNPLEQAIFEW